MPSFHSLLVNEIAPGTGIDPDHFWQGVADIWAALGPENQRLLGERDALQTQIDQWHRDHQGEAFDADAYEAFLREIGYLHPEPAPFSITTDNVDPEIAQIAGPQLVVPVMNARYALNAANARWGSLYDALYGTDAIPEDGGAERGGAYNPVRGERVIAWARDFLDTHCPLTGGTHADATAYAISAGALSVQQVSGEPATLVDPSQFVGYTGNADAPETVLLRHNGLHIEIQIDRNHPVGATDGAGVKDVCLESALTTIQDCEDSVAAVDAEDKIICYRNWLGLMKGNLVTRFEKEGKTLERKLNPNRGYISKEGKGLKLHGRSLLLIRNVGHLMTNPSIILKDGSEIPEGLMDAFITTAAALHDKKKKGNSRAGSIYIVKPKMHGPDETAFTNEIFTKVEEVLKLKKYTCKIGIMDEERRTSSNLKECIRTLKHRVFFINTGFLDRTGDEMHTSMEAGPMIKKGDMKSSKWIEAYENNNVDIGLACGFSGKAQIGKGMWAMPDKMKDMLDQKTGHLKAGANCAWVPSPTAAALHALHYHEINIFDIQKKLSKRDKAKIDDLLTIPIADRPNWSVDEINKEISNSAQTLLGYVVRWIDQGVGCSKVPDINNVGLMEDRATLRISSQHIANWVHHGVTTKMQVIEIMKEMAKIVDKQNENDRSYVKMSSDYDRSIAFQTACELIFKGKEQPSGYTEPLLHLNRLKKKSA